MAPRAPFGGSRLGARVDGRAGLEGPNIWGRRVSGHDQWKNDY